MEQFEYDVALSFAGENRDIVSNFATLLKKRGVKVFYDEDHEADLWGENLVDQLGEVYHGKARHCIIFVSEPYVEKHWTNHERQHAQARALKTPGYILPIQIDDTKLPGLPETVTHVDLRKRSLEQIADLVVQKLNKQPEGSPPSEDDLEPIHIPKVPRDFSDLEKEEFALETFSYVADYFQRGLRQLEKSDGRVKSKFEKYGEKKFVATLYLDGEQRNQMKVWVGGIGSYSKSQQISYYQGHNMDVNDDSSMNGWATLTDDRHQMKMTLNEHCSMGVQGMPADLSGKENIATGLWTIFVDPLTR